MPNSSQSKKSEILSGMPSVLGTRLLETVIASTAPRPDTRNLIHPNPESWELEFPDLTHLPISSKGDTSAKICIATEDIVGPVRNGGIGTTYSFLAKVLAEEGFDVTILYLRGDYVEIGTLDDWIKYYADHGITFKVVEDYYTAEKCSGNSDRWTGPMYNMFRHLQDTHYDVVHVSEWRGSGYLSLLAKRQGWAFENTHFVVKCSSPWLWNRLYGSHPLKTIGDLDKIHAEQQSVELGDHVIGGSAHLLRWMASQGYKLPIGQTFVQPNILSTDVLTELMGSRSYKSGDRIDVAEIVFFGRLEARKGLEIFCDAIDNLIREGCKLPPKISFMGKRGARLETRPDLNSLEFIEQITANWPVEISILTEFQQEEALRYLLSENRLAVMPSIIENSSLAVYEAVICKIPFIASNSGGTPELITKEFHEDTLCDAHPLSLSKKLETALKKGAIVAEASFDNVENTKTWINYHKNIKSIAKLSKSKAKKIVLPKIAAIVYHRDDINGLKTTIKSLINNDYPNLHIIVVDDGSRETQTIVELTRIRKLLDKHNGTFLEVAGLDYGLAANVAAEQTNASCFYFMHSGNALLPGALEQMAKVLKSQNLGCVTGFFLEYNDKAVPLEQGSADVVHMPMLGNPGYTMLKNTLQYWDMLVDAKAFKAVGGFTGDYRQINSEKELYHSLEFNGFPGQTIPKPLYWGRKINDLNLIKDRYNLRASAIRALRPSIRFGPLVFSRLMLFTYGLYQRNDQFEQRLNLLTSDRDRQREAKLKRIEERDTFKSKLDEARSELENMRSQLEEMRAQGLTPGEHYKVIRNKLRARNMELAEAKSNVAELRLKLAERNKELAKIKSRNAGLGKSKFKRMFKFFKR